MFWFVIHTKPRQEQRALHNLQQQGYTCYLPLLPVERLQRGELVQTREALFPRYLFVKLDPSAQGRSWAPIRSTKGVSRLVTFGDTPAKVDEALIVNLQRNEQTQETRPLFSAGDRVEVADGAFAGLEGLYQTSDGEKRALVLIEMLSKPVHLALHKSGLRRIV